MKEKYGKIQKVALVRDANQTGESLRQYSNLYTEKTALC